MGGSKNFYGMVLAGQSLGYVVFTPLVAKLYDKTRRGKLILLICMIVKLLSNVLYAMSISIYFPLIGFFLNGAANSAYTVLYGAAVRYTSYENRSKLFIVVNSAFSLGCTCGPVFGSVVTFNGKLFGLDISDGNSPVIVLAFIWCVMIGFMVIISSEFGKDEISFSDEEREMLTEKDLSEKLEGNKESSSLLCSIFIILTIFSTSLVTSTVSGMTSLLTMELFHLKLVHVKLLFAVGMVSMLLMDLLSYLAVNCCKERTLLVFTVIIQLPAIVFMCTYALLWQNAPSMMSCTLVIFVSSGLPVTTYSFAGSLLSKITPLRHASFIQSLAMTGYCLAALFGRAMSGRVFSQQLLIIYSSCLMTISIFDILWWAYLFKRLPR